MHDFLTELGGLSRFTIQFFRELFRQPYEHKELVRQSYKIGLSTLPLIGITAFIMGLVLTLQSKPIMTEFGAESWLPGMVAVSIVREIGPVITALICAGKIGSGIGAELGSMRVTEQIDAMEVSGTNPMKYLVVTRVLATTFMIPILVLYADLISFYGSYIAVNLQDFVSLPLFVNLAFDPLHYYDLIPATIKTFFFGFAIGIIGCYKGYYSENGTEGVGKAANSAVVISSLVIFIMDLIAVQLAELFNIFN
ncbi:MAG: ABC transporter permease [Bacteroidetes bacterium GWF2_33_16]|nr:MAG: ABC transporter permease [Bacteroidetes bacterium GWE2_32_14]OFY07907.1 MAG: ABC transporter permease [Bacteroidetes bacterium GWF2_33_16]